MTEKLQLYRYNLPFKKPFYAAGTRCDERRGLLLGSHRRFWSEIAPLPGFSQESTEEALVFLQRHADSLNKAFQQQRLDAFLNSENPFTAESLALLPSVRFGISMLAEQQKASRAKLPLYRYWIRKQSMAGNHAPARPTVSGTDSGQSSGEESAAEVHCNALCRKQEPEALRGEVDDFQKAGFRCIKVKLPDSVDQAFEVISELCLEFENLKFRFDANRCFNLEQAHRLLGKITGPDCQVIYRNPPQYIEEPVFLENNENPAEKLSALRRYGIALAADESVRSPEQADFLARENGFDRLVIKPMLLGSFDEFCRILQCGLPVTVTSSLETDTGRSLLAHLAAFCNYSIQSTEHGLCTGGLFQKVENQKQYQPRTNAGKQAGRWLDEAPAARLHGDTAVIRLGKDCGPPHIPNLCSEWIDTSRNLIQEV